MSLILVLAWSLLMLQDAADQRDSVPGPVVNTPAAAAEALSMDRVSLEEIPALVSSGEYQPVASAELQRLLAVSAENSGNPARPQIRAAEYRAKLSGTRLTDGALDFYLYPDSDRVSDGPLFLGLTSLRQLAIRDPQGEIPLGADIRRRLYVLKPGLSGNLSGQWSADGLVAGEAISFRLELPEATTSKLQLTTPAGISVTGAGTLVLGPEESAGELLWTLYPSDATKLMFSCRRVQGPVAQQPLSLTSFGGGHVLNGDILTSRWTIGLSSEIPAGSVLNLRLARGSRVSDVAMDDRRTLEWEVNASAAAQELRIRLPGNGTGGSLTVSAATVIANPETWELPALVPLQWQQGSGDLRGPLLVPTGTVTVTLPPSMNVDDWILKGLQERDVVAGTDQSRTFQLTQFQAEATAIVRTSTTQARLSDTLVTLLEPTGRLAAVRCFLNLQCEDAAVVEARWQVARGWQVIAARYASNGRSLYFEMPTPAADQLSVPLTVHLPETLEPGAARVIELLLQQESTVTSESLQLPVLPGDQIERTQSFLLTARPSFNGSRLDRRWTQGRARISQEEFQSRNPWFPANLLAPGIEYCLPGESLLPTGISEQENDAEQNRLLHTIRLVDGAVQEETRVDLLVPQTASELHFVLPVEGNVEVRWLLQGLPVTPEVISDGGGASVWREYRIPLAQVAERTALTVTCTTRHPVADQWTAMIAFPRDQGGIQGVLQISKTDGASLSAENLMPESAIASTTGLSGWRLPTIARPVQIRRVLNAEAETVQVTDLTMFHLLSECETGIEHRTMAVMDVTTGTDRSVLPIVRDQVLQPLVLVNGRRVKIQETQVSAEIPLPAGRVPCRVVLLWNEPTLAPEQLEVQRALPRLFGSEVSVPVAVHHLLVAPELQSSLAHVRSYLEQTGRIPEIPSALIDRSASVSGAPQQEDSLVSRESSDVRAFAVGWRLATTRGARHQTVVDPNSEQQPIQLRLSSIRRRFAVVGGTALLCIGVCLAGTGWIIRHLQVAAIPVVVLSLLGLWNLPPLVKASIDGAFWGGAAGVLLVITLRGVLQYLHRWRLPAGHWTGFVAVWCLSSVGVFSQEPLSPEPPRDLPGQTGRATVLIPGEDVSGDQLVFVRAGTLQSLRETAVEVLASRPSAVVTSVNTMIHADAGGSVELVMNIGVSAVSGSREVVLQLPIQGSRLVGCLVDGNRVLPESDGDDHIRVLLPPSVEVSSLPLSVTEMLTSPEASADERAAFTAHQVQCRLRPVTTRQASGVQFRIPGLPCPLVRIEVVAAPGLYSTARIQTADGIQQWDPSVGPVLLNGLATTEGADVRLLQSGLDKGSRGQAAVEVMAISENTVGVQTLNCYCRFSSWNLLSPEVRYRMPQGYQLVGVSGAAGLESGELLWSVQDQSATISLPTGVPNEFVLLLQLRSVKPIPVEEQQIPIGELQQFADCIPATNVLIAARTTSVFAPVVPDRSVVVPAAFTELSERWGQWLRRSDNLYQASAGLGVLKLTFEARRSRHEIRMAQTCVIGEKQVEWNCSMDVETSRLPVFRHRLTVPEQIAISDVKVAAGEANRLASWHRRGDQLVILLREGTTGLHVVTLTGSQELRPDDTQIRLSSPRVQDAQILESSMTLLDQHPEGLTFLDPGDAIPDPPINTGDLLQPGQEVRFQIVGESKPVVLQRLNPVDPRAEVVAFRSPDRIVFFVRMSQWSGSLGPLQMQFPEAARLLSEPVVLTEREVLPLTREGNRFSAGQDLVRQLFGVTDFTVVWSLPLPNSTNSLSEGNSVLPWPVISERLQWVDVLLIAGEDLRTRFPDLETGVIPDWVVPIANRLSITVSGPRLSAVRLPGALEKTSAVQIQLPAAPAASTPESLRELAVVALTTVVVTPGQSPPGQSDLVIFSSRFPDQCILRIPDGILITDLPDDGTFRWLDRERRRLAVDVRGPLTQVTLRWLGEKTRADLFSLRASLLFPVAEQCDVRNHVTVVSALREVASLRGTDPTLTAEQQSSGLKDQLAVSSRSLMDALPRSEDTEQLPQITESLVTTLIERSEAFAKEHESGSVMRHVRRRQSTDRPLVIYWRRRLELSTVIPVGIGLFVLVTASLSSTTSRRASSQPFLVISEGGRGIPTEAGEASAATRIMLAPEEAVSRSDQGSAARDRVVPGP